MNKKQEIINNMNIKSNLDLIERLSAASKYLDEASHIAGRTYGMNGSAKDQNSDPLSKHYQDYIPITSQKDLSKLNFALMRLLMAIDGELSQFRARHGVHYLEFPHQNKKMVKWFGNHHVTTVTGVEKKGNELILHLGKKRKAVTGFLDILNYRDVRKTQSEPSSMTHMPKGLHYKGDK